MPWGWECRARLVKQNTLKPAERRGPISQETKTPGPSHYDVPHVVGGPGFSHIKRMPAYTFRYMTKIIHKPTALPRAPMFNTRGMGPKGSYRIPGSIISPQIDEPLSKTKVPGPGTYVPRGDSRYKRPPAYTMRPAARPPYQAWDQWTPPPNMYYPPMPKRKPPSFTFGFRAKDVNPPEMPGPGTHEPNFGYVEKTRPAFSFGGPFKPKKLPTVPPPNTYCEKKFNVSKRSIPAPSFGIRHTPYLGEQPTFMKPSKLDIQISGAT
ncbi:ciliary microtubule associated protein 1A-like [Anticarsia gemmatalis]|uniref:ciliary microtubule associated protein 1A-like n=1 Tax=Anticarsia gemmatalis TaxID=129554 RepID=UPI003F760837